MVRTPSSGACLGPLTLENFAKWATHPPSRLGQCPSDKSGVSHYKGLAQTTGKWDDTVSQ